MKPEHVILGILIGVAAFVGAILTVVLGFYVLWFMVGLAFTAAFG